MTPSFIIAMKINVNVDWDWATVTVTANVYDSKETLIISSSKSN